MISAKPTCFWMLSGIAVWRQRAAHCSRNMQAPYGAELRTDVGGSPVYWARTKPLWGS